METRVGLSRAGGAEEPRHAHRLAAAAVAGVDADRRRTASAPSIASALRIHADTLRQQRQHAAEEMAAKASVKMSFPLVLFIFPATFIVLAGPTVIGLMNSGMM